MALAERATAILDQARSAGGRVYLHAAHVQLAIARAWLRADQADRARKLLEPVRVAAEAAGWVEFSASASLLLAEAHLAIGDPDAAGRHLDRCRAIADSVGLAVVADEGAALAARLTASRR